MSSWILNEGVQAVNKYSVEIGLQLPLAKRMIKHTELILISMRS